MRMRRVPCGSLSAEIGSHSARAACGEAHVIHDPNPFPVCILRFDVRRDRFDASLVSGKHAGSGEIFNLAVHEQPERAAAIRFAQIKLQAMSFGKPLEVL